MRSQFTTDVEVDAPPAPDRARSLEQAASSVTRRSAVYTMRLCPSQLLVCCVALFTLSGLFRSTAVTTEQTEDGVGNNEACCCIMLYTVCTAQVLVVLNDLRARVMYEPES